MPATTTQETTLSIDEFTGRDIEDLAEHIGPEWATVVDNIAGGRWDLITPRAFNVITWIVARKADASLTFDDVLDAPFIDTLRAWTGDTDTSDNSDDG